MEYTHEVVIQALSAHQSHGVGRITVYLSDTDTAWNPASTNRPIFGPNTVMYERHLDGGITAYIEGVGRG